ncbi:MAG: protein kinase, partial [Anaerolineae bacterium]
MGDLTGQTLDRYEIVELIGEGGMATVYRARQPRLQRDVALKVMQPVLAADPTFRQRFEREAQTVANLRHPNILTVHDYGESDDGQLYLVVEYVRGGALRDALEQGMALERAVEITAQVAEALDYAHGQGVVHRDVKPNNILLTRDGRPLLADFGLVKPIQSDRRLTATGVMLGTPDYMAPEQVQGEEVDGRADIYALGVMLYEMLTGQHPYSGETPMSVALKHLSEPMPRPSKVNPSVSPMLDEIVAKATAKSPHERYQRAGDMARALREVLILGAAPGSPSQWAAPLPTIPPVAPALTAPVVVNEDHDRPSRRLWLALSGVLALGIVLVALVLFSSLSKDQEAGAVGAVPSAQPGETMILIAQFKAQAGSESYDVSQRIYDKLSDDLHQLGESGVSVYQVPEVVESSEAAVVLGSRYGATTVLWGYYDDIGISPNVEAVGGLEDNLLSVGLERFNLDAGEAVNFKLYIAKDMPSEMSFLTAMSLFQVAMLQGNVDEMMAAIEMAERNLPADPQFRSGGEMIYFMQTAIALMRGDAQDGVELMNQAIAVNPNVAMFYAARGGCYFQVGELERALADWESVIERDPRNVSAHGMKGLVLWQMGDLEAASSALNHMIELKPDEPSSYYGLGILNFEMGNLDLALDGWEQVEKLDPENEYLPVFRGLVYEKMGQAERAEADYRQV